MIDQDDAVVHDDADQDHDADHGHERERRAGRREEQEHAEDREHDRAEDDREREQQRFEQRGHDEEYAGDAEHDVRCHHLLGLVLTLEAAPELPAVARWEFDLSHQFLDPGPNVVERRLIVEVAFEDDGRLAVGTANRIR